MNLQPEVYCLEKKEKKLAFDFCSNVVLVTGLAKRQVFMASNQIILYII